MDLNKINIEKEITLGEDSSRQFKEQIHSAAKLAEEMCAMSNSKGGVIYVGVKDDTTITGLTHQQIGDYNQYISNAANENIKPAMYPQTKITEIDGKVILLIHVSEGPSKPYCTSAGVYWVKSVAIKENLLPRNYYGCFRKAICFILMKL